MRAAARAAARWLGEAVVGLIPLLAYLAIHQFGHLPVASVCQGLDGAGSPTGCIQLAETVAPEVCILAVVISGLSVISVARRESTIWTYLLVLFAVIALILGSLL